MAIRIRQKRKTYKGKTYLYWTVERVFRDPEDTSKIRHQFIAHLGKDSEAARKNWWKVKANWEERQSESRGRYSLKRLTALIERNIK